MDIKKTLEEISRIEKEKAQLELRQTQLAERQDALAKRLELIGISPKELDAEANRLEVSINQRMNEIRNGPAKTAAVKSKGTTSTDIDDITSALEME